MLERFKRWLRGEVSSEAVGNPVFTDLRGFEEVQSIMDVRLAAGVPGYVLPGEKAIPAEITDPVVRQVFKLSVEPSTVNLVFCWENEPMVQKVARLMHESILAGGFEFVDERGEPLGEGDELELLREIYRVFPLGDFVEVTVENLTIFGNQLWKPRFEGGEFKSLDPLDWKNVKVYRHPVAGYLMYVLEERVPIEKEIVSVENGRVVEYIDYEDWKKLDPSMMKTKLARTSLVYFKLFPEEVLHVKMGHRGFPVGFSPLASVVNAVVRKRLLEWFMGRTCEIWGSPILVLRTGVGIPPETLASMMRRPEDWAAYQARIKEGADMLVKYRQFGVFSLAGDQELQVLFPGRGAFDYVRALEYLNREIAGCMWASTALFEARGVELATSRTIKSVWDLAVDGMRRRLEDCLNNQFHPMYIRETEWKGELKAKFRFRRLEIPEEVLTRVFELVRKRVERKRPEEEG